LGVTFIERGPVDPCHRARAGSSAWRALANLIGNWAATVVVAAWEGDLDRDRAKHVLEGDELVDVTAG
jgi:hypothetical protein